MRVAYIYTPSSERAVHDVRFVQILDGVLLITTTRGQVAYAPGQWQSYEIESKDD